MSNIRKDARLDTLTVNQSLILPVVEQDINSPLKGRFIYNSITNVPSYADGSEWHDITPGEDFQAQIDVIDNTITNISNASVILESADVAFPNGSVITAGSGITVTPGVGITTISSNLSNAPVILESADAAFPNGSVITAGSGITVTPGVGITTISSNISNAPVILESADVSFPNGSVITAGPGITVTPGIGITTISTNLTPSTLVSLNTASVINNLPLIYNIPANAQNITFTAQGAGGGGACGSPTGEGGGGGQGGFYILDQPLAIGGGTLTLSLGIGGPGAIYPATGGADGGRTTIQYQPPSASIVIHYVQGGLGGGIGVPSSTIGGLGGKTDYTNGPAYKGWAGGNGGGGTSGPAVAGTSSITGAPGGSPGSSVGFGLGGGGGGAGYLTAGAQGGNGNQDGSPASTFGSGGGGGGGTDLGGTIGNGGKGGNSFVILNYYI